MVPADAAAAHGKHVGFLVQDSLEKAILLSVIGFLFSILPFALSKLPSLHLHEGWVPWLKMWEGIYSQSIHVIEKAACIRTIGLNSMYVLSSIPETNR